MSLSPEKKRSLQQECHSFSIWKMLNKISESQPKKYAITTRQASIEHENQMTSNLQEINGCLHLTSTSGDFFNSNHQMPVTFTLFLSLFL